MQAVNNDYFFDSCLQRMNKGGDEAAEIIPRIDTYMRRGGLITQKDAQGRNLYDLAKEKKLHRVMMHIKQHYWVEVEKNIFVSPEEECLAKIKDAITMIKKGEVGQRLIRRIGEAKHKAWIEMDNKKYSCCDAFDHEKAQTRGVGSSSCIIIGGDWKNPVIGFEPAQLIEMPFFITLAHELIHHYHNAYGKESDITHNDKLWTSDEEFHTIVGYPSKKVHRDKPKISENSIRREHRLPERHTHLNGTEENLRLAHPNRLNFKAVRIDQKNNVMNAINNIADAIFNFGNSTQQIDTEENETNKANKDKTLEKTVVKSSGNIYAKIQSIVKRILG